MENNQFHPTNSQGPCRHLLVLFHHSIPHSQVHIHPIQSDRSPVVLVKIPIIVALF